MSDIYVTVSNVRGDQGLQGIQGIQGVPGEVTDAELAAAVAPMIIATNPSETPPTSPKDGQLWVDPATMTLFVWYDDGDSDQWVSVSKADDGVASEAAGTAVSTMSTHTANADAHSQYAKLASPALVSPSLSNPTMTGNVLVPDANADGEALAHSQNQAALGVNWTFGAGGTIDGTTTLTATAANQLQLENSLAADILLTDTGATADRGVYRIRTAADVFRISQLDDALGFVGDIVLFTASTGELRLTSNTSVTVPNAADADTATAAQRTTVDSTTGRLAIDNAEVGDTGWRDVSSLLATGWTCDANYPQIRRVGNVVHLVARNLDYSSGGSTTVGTLAPAGLRPNITHQIVSANSAGAAASPTISMFTVSNGGVVLGSTTVDDQYFSTVWTTADAWPSSLLGTQVTAPLDPTA